MSVQWNTHTYAQLSSTQDYARELAEEGLPEGTVVQALIQTKGRGRQGRDWHSPMGNLYMSLILRPECEAVKAAQMSFVVAVAVSRAIGHFLADGHEKSLKWPNDILIDGKKCAGILIESVMDGKGIVQALAIGIGVNILGAPEGAAQLAGISKGPVAIHPFRDQVLAELSVLYAQWKNQGFAPARKKWLDEAHRLGQVIAVALPDGSCEGVFTDIDRDGALVLTLADGTRKLVHTGDVMLEQAGGDHAAGC